MEFCKFLLQIEIFAFDIDIDSCGGGKKLSKSGVGRELKAEGQIIEWQCGA